MRERIIHAERLLSNVFFLLLYKFPMQNARRKKAPAQPGHSLSKSLAEFAASAAKEIQSFSAGACTWQKIHLRLQVWNLFALGEQIMRAADCKKLSEKPGRAFPTS
ncbi:MAG: hypothetical protein J6B70_00980 [Oscillospiraceae bacterium]|nr:hypothetical protein [Oscillospiraceae bacterium]